jgi:Zn-dependent M16 (insulinase) family peptidase
VIADERELQSLVSEIRSSGITSAIDLEPTLLPVALEVPNLAYVVDTQVNFCAAAYRCDNESSGDAAAIHVLAAVLRNQYLHSEVREKGGAYGAGASFDAAHGVFRMYSFRDPELLSTLRVFERALIAFNDLAVNEAMVEEAVLGLVSSIDAPGSPAGEARDDCYQRLQGRSPERRRALRQAIVEVTPMDVQRVAQRVLTGASSQVVVTDSIGAKSLPNGFTVRSI